MARYGASCSTETHDDGTLHPHRCEPLPHSQGRAGTRCSSRYGVGHLQEGDAKGEMSADSGQMATRHRIELLFSTTCVQAKVKMVSRSRMSFSRCEWPSVQADTQSANHAHTQFMQLALACVDLKRAFSEFISHSHHLPHHADELRVRHPHH